MIKVILQEIKVSPITQISFYNDINPIPFSLKIGDHASMPTTIYARNLKDGNFIEFRFDKNNLSLYEITLVTIQENSVKFNSLDLIKTNPSELFTCNIDEENSSLENAMLTRITRDKNSICIDWSTDDSPIVKYFCLAPNYFIGVNNKSCLLAILLKNLNEDDIYSIFGF